MKSRRQFLASSALPVAAAVALSVPGAVARAAGPHPDAELLALGREWSALLRQIDHGSGDRSDAALMPLLDRWNALSSRIMATPYETFAGQAVQFAVLWMFQELDPDEVSGPTERSSPDLKWLWAVKTNAERLAGGAA